MYLQQAPVALDIRSPMDLVYECFVKLGLRYICVTKDGRFAGVVSLVAKSSRLQYADALLDTQKDIREIYARPGGKGVDL